jgi:chromosome segregation ATPase
MENKSNSIPPKAITRQDVYNAIEELIEEYGRYTNKMIQDKIGGSSATIQKYRKMYEEEHREGVKKKALVLKDVEQQRIFDAVGDVLSIRATEISNQYQGEIDRLSDEIGEISAEKDALVQQTDEQLRQIKTLTEEALHSKARLEIVDQEHAEAKVAVIQQYEEHKAIISEQLEAAKAHYEGSLDALKQERDALQLKVTETVLEAKVADVKLEEAYKTISRLQAEVIEVKSELRELRTPAAAQPQQKKKGGTAEPQAGDLLSFEQQQ